MATYKVIQDIEAEDKLLGPLTLRQFIYAGACVIFLYLSFLAVTKGAPFMIVVFLPLAAIGGFFAWPWSRDQPTEVWALARIRFMVKPKVRIWNQSGVKELVTITAPKKIVQIYSNGLSQNEVQNRLKALADTIDSRGWAVKNVNVNMYGQQQMQTVPDSDRLIDMAALPQQVPDFEVQASEDILEDSSPVARQFDSMIAASTKAHREEILEHLQGSDQSEPIRAGQNTSSQAQEQPANNYWFLNQSTPGTAVPTNAVTFNTQVVTPGTPIDKLPVAPGDPTEDEEAIVKRLREEEERGQSVVQNAHWHTIQPLSAQQQSAVPPAAQPAYPQNYTMPAQPGMSPQQAQQGYAAPAPYGQPPIAPNQQMSGPTPTIAQNSATAPVTQPPDPAILQLASNDDLDVATLARQANKHKDELRDEVVISLH